MTGMTHKSFTTLSEAYAFRYDLRKQGIRSHWGVDVNGVYTVSYKSDINQSKENTNENI